MKHIENVGPAKTLGRISTRVTGWLIVRRNQIALRKTDQITVFSRALQPQPQKHAQQQMIFAKYSQASQLT
jgi:hypothetical protein